MDCERLFYENEFVVTESDQEKYKLLIDEIYENKRLTNHQELELCRENLKLLLKQYPLERYNYDGDVLYWSLYIDEAASLAKDLGNNLMNYKILKEISDFTYNPNPHEFINVLRSLYIPETINDFEVYIKSMKRVCNAFFYDYFEEEENDINTGHSELDNLYKYLLKVIKRIPARELYDHDTMICIIFAYIHLNKIESFELLEEYLNNRNYYQDKIKINDRVPSYFHEYDYEKAKELFDNLENFLKREKIIIK